MEVTCPNCGSRFNLPDAVGKPGARLRCSVCKEIFRLEASSSGEAGFNLDFNTKLSLDHAPPSSKGRKLIIALVAVLLLAGGGGGGWWYYKNNIAPSPAAEATLPLEKKVEMLTMRNVRQYYVNNEKVGQIFVIEGKVVNEFPAPKELIQVEAAIYGPDKQVLASKTQLAGTVLSLFQLQVLGEKELEAFLHNKIEVLTNNTNIPTGGEVPFMVLFYAPSPNVSEFGVKIVDVKDVPPTKP